MQIDLAENWWLEEGRYYNSDLPLFPKEVIKKAFVAGFDLGFIVGKSEGSNRVMRCTDGDWPGSWPSTKV